MNDPCVEGHGGIQDEQSAKETEKGQLVRQEKSREI